MLDAYIGLCMPYIGLCMLNGTTDIPLYQLQYPLGYNNFGRDKVNICKTSGYGKEIITYFLTMLFPYS